VIDEPLRTQLYEQHPANVIRLILNRDEPGDDEQSNRYTRAARFLKNWRAEGLLQKDSHPAIYAYYQLFEYAGQSHTRRGFMCRTRLEPFGEGSIYPHEETHASAKEDRLRLMRACRANLSQIFGLYPDPDNEVQTLLETLISQQTPMEARDHLGVIHRLWPVIDLPMISRITALMDSKPIFIADGHHRYETACNYRDELARKQPISENHPAHSVLMMCVGMSDPGMVVLPTHRLFRGVPPLTCRELADRLGTCFQCRVVGQGTKIADSIWSDIQQEGEQGMLGLYTARDQSWSVARITTEGRARMQQVAAEHSAQWQGLGVSILHRLIVDSLLNLPQLPKPEYVHLVQEVVERLDQNGEDDPEFSLAALVMPATLDHIRTLSQQGERMPAKSTYFYPKLLSGLVINPLE
jgi:uncharacterized protein (DUF1015 family)